MKKRILSTLLALCMVLALLPGTARAASIVASGTCGSAHANDVSWSLDSDGILSLTGTGKMVDYNLGHAPWYDYRTLITSVYISPGILNIGREAFDHCTNMENVSIPNGLMEIGLYAFSNCSSLKGVVLPDSMDEIGDSAFHECINLASVKLPSKLKAIGGGVFYDCKSLKSIAIPGTVHTIRGNAFNGSGLTSITLPASVTTLGVSVFSRCQDLKSAELLGKILNLSEATFSYCTALEKVVLSAETRTIGKTAFSNCGALASIALPASVTEIGNSAFNKCTNLTDVYFAGTEEQWSEVNKVNVNNGPLFSANVYCNSTGPSANTFTVTFNPNDGNLAAGSRLKSVTNGSTYGELPTPTKSGYTFLGWFTGVSTGTQVLPATKVNLSANQTLYARWEKISTTKTYTVTFDPDGGSVSTTTKTYTEGAALGTLPTPTKSGYDFAGWYTSKTGGTQVTTATKVTGNQTLYARWTAKPAATKTYTITLNANSGKVSPSSVKVEAGKAYGTLPTPTRTGFTFNGWYTSKIGGTKVASTAKPSKSLTLYAHWTRTRSFLVTFDPNGGDIYQDMKIVVSGGLYGELPTPTRQDYIFKGWYTTKTGSTKVTATKRVSLTGNQTLYAKWEKSATAKTTSGKWTVTIPSYYELALYGSADTPKSSKTVNIAEKTGGYLNVTCTKKAVLSTGVVRYYGTVNKTKTWFTYSCEMDVK